MPSTSGSAFGTLTLLATVTTTTSSLQLTCAIEDTEGSLDITDWRIVGVSIPTPSSLPHSHSVFSGWCLLSQGFLRIDPRWAPLRDDQRLRKLAELDRE